MQVPGTVTRGEAIPKVVLPVAGWVVVVIFHRNGPISQHDLCIPFLLCINAHFKCARRKAEAELS